MHRRPVRPRSTFLAGDGWRRIKPILQRLLRQAFRQRPATPARCARKMQSRPAVAVTPRLTAIWRLDMPEADSHRGFCARVISVQACPAPVERSQAMPIRRSPNGAHHPHPQSSRSPGMGGRDSRDYTERITATLVWTPIVLCRRSGRRQHCPQYRTATTAATRLSCSLLRLKSIRARAGSLHLQERNLAARQSFRNALPPNEAPAPGRCGGYCIVAKLPRHCAAGLTRSLTSVPRAHCAKDRYP